MSMDHLVEKYKIMLMCMHAYIQTYIHVIAGFQAVGLSKIAHI